MIRLIEWDIRVTHYYFFLRFNFFLVLLKISNDERISGIFYGESFGNDGSNTVSAGDGSSGLPRVGAFNFSNRIIRLPSFFGLIRDYGSRKQS